MVLILLLYMFNGKDNHIKNLLYCLSRHKVEVKVLKERG